MVEIWVFMVFYLGRKGKNGRKKVETYKWLIIVSKSNKHIMFIMPISSIDVIQFTFNLHIFIIQIKVHQNRDWDLALVIL